MFHRAGICIKIVTKERLPCSHIAAASRYYIASGHKLDRYILANSITPMSFLDIGILEEVLCEPEILTKSEVE